MRKGRMRQLQHLTDRWERGWSSMRVTIILKSMKKNLLRKSLSNGFANSTNENMIQQVRNLISSYVSSLSNALNDRYPGIKQHTILVSRECVLMYGASRRRRRKRQMATVLGLKLYFCYMNLRSGNLSRAVGLIACIQLFRVYITGLSIILIMQRILTYLGDAFANHYICLSSNQIISFPLFCFQINIKFNPEVNQEMDSFFETDEFQTVQVGQQSNLQANYDGFNMSEPSGQTAFNSEPVQFNFNQSSTNYAYQPQPQENDFNDFQQDETAKRIREEEERIQNLLREKSEREWTDKQARKAEGRRLLQEYNDKKEHQKRERAQQNLRKQAISKEELAKLNVEAGWRKVITNVNVRQGEHKGKKDINRMREAILHRREDDKR